MKFQLINFQIKGDERGSLISLERGKNIPFTIKRIYYIFDTKKNVRRGYHAHKNLKQVLVCVSGSCKILLDDGSKKDMIKLDKPETALFIKGTIWREIYDFSSDCVLMVLADNFYDEEDYLRNYEDFLKYIGKK
jgi:dTDP-4-dehydrorhamnose 3,5-epimerase-like enzyme